MRLYVAAFGGKGTACGWYVKMDGELSGSFLGMFAFDMMREQPEQARTWKNKRTLSKGEGRARLLKKQKTPPFRAGFYRFQVYNYLACFNTK
jgi:hypothetical protein